MPEWRKLHVKITESLDVNEMPNDFTRLLWVMLPLVVCREGRGVDNPSWVRSRTMPLRDDVSSKQIEAAMRWYAQRGMIQRYVVDGRGYFKIIKFSRYQSTLREADSDYPSPDDAENTTQELVRSNSGVSQELVVSNSGVSQEQVVSYSVLDVDIDIDIDKEGEESASFSAQDSGTEEIRTRHNARRTAPRPPRPATTDDGDDSKKAGPQKTAIPPGVEEFRRQAHRYPAKSWYTDIASIVGRDEAQVRRWGQIVHYWVGQGWNPANVSGMLEFFKRGDTPGQNAAVGRQKRNVQLDQVGDIVDAAFDLIGGGDV